MNKQIYIMLLAAVTAHCFAAEERQNVHTTVARESLLIRHRGKVGFIAGAAAGLAATYIIRPYIEQKLQQIKDQESRLIYGPLYHPDKISANGEHQEGPMYSPELSNQTTSGK